MLWFWCQNSSFHNYFISVVGVAHRSLDRLLKIRMKKEKRKTEALEHEQEQVNAE